jgi:hypothetical protein
MVQKRIVKDWMKANCGRFVFVGAMVLLTRTAAFSQAPLPPAASAFPKTFVGRPEFTTKAGTRTSGTAFLAKIENGGPVYLLTVRHLLGPAGGFPELIPPDQVPSFVSAIRLQYLFAPGSKLFRVEGLKVPDTADPKAPLFNVAIFKTSDGLPVEAGTMTSDAPAPGDPVWILANVRGGVAEGQHVHSARVSAYHPDRWLIGDFDNQAIVPNGASGAPVLNSAGKIVGIYCTHATRNDKVAAFIIPSGLIAKIITGS